MPKYSHQVMIAFDVESDDPDGEDITPEMFRKALLRRVNDIDRNGEWDAACSIEDSVEID